VSNIDKQRVSAVEQLGYIFGFFTVFRGHARYRHGLSTPELLVRQGGAGAAKVNTESFDANWNPGKLSGVCSFARLSVLGTT